MSDLLIHATFWDPQAEILFSKSRMRDPDFRISVIADVTCDLNGSIPSTTQATTIEDKFYGYDPMSEKVVEPFAEDCITVMAIDHLPDELPRDASRYFGEQLIKYVLPDLLSNGSPVLDKATIVKNGKLTEYFSYLKNYAEGKL